MRERLGTLERMELQALLEGQVPQAPQGTRALRAPLALQEGLDPREAKAPVATLGNRVKRANKVAPGPLAPRGHLVLKELMALLGLKATLELRAVRGPREVLGPVAPQELSAAQGALGHKDLRDRLALQGLQGAAAVQGLKGAWGRRVKLEAAAQRDKWALRGLRDRRETSDNQARMVSLVPPGRLGQRGLPVQQGQPGPRDNRGRWAT
jgi:hypothetical protein